MATRPRLGDLYELDTPCGRAYLQLAQVHPEFGTLVRVLPGLYDSQPDVAALASGPDRFVVFYPVAFTLRDGVVRYLGNANVPPEARRFPLMKWPIGHDAQRNGWAIWDGDRELARTMTLNEEQKAYPEPAIWNHTFLVDSVASEFSWRDTAETPWRPLRRPRGCDEPFSDPDADQHPDRVYHYLYFADEESAIRARESAASIAGMVETEIRPSGVTDETLLLVSHATGIDPESQRKAFEAVAREHHGEYDGWEAPV